MHPFDDVDGSHSTVKIVNTIFFMNTGLAGANVNYQTSDDILNDFTKPVGQLRSGDTGFSGLVLRGRNLKFKLSGSSKGQPCSYEGYSILQGTTQLITFK